HLDIQNADVACAQLQRAAANGALEPMSPRDVVEYRAKVGLRCRRVLSTTNPGGAFDSIDRLSDRIELAVKAKRQTPAVRQPPSLPLSISGRRSVVRHTSPTAVSAARSLQSTVRPIWIGAIALNKSIRPCDS